VASTQDDATRADAAQNEPHDAPPADAPQADAPQVDAPQADAPQADAPRRATSDERRELVRLWAVTGALLVALGAVALTLGGAPLEHARVEVELGSAGALDDEALATTVAFSEPFELDATRTIAIVTRGSADRDAAPDAADERPTREGPPVPLEAHGTLLVSLVDLETDQVREIEIDLGDTGRFAGVRAGRYVVRLTGGGAGRALGVVRSGGIPWPLTALAALLLLAPAIWRSLRTLRSHRS
jgi:hypothetical protein